MTIEEILADFAPMDAEKRRLKDRSPVTIWLTPDAKARYDKLQEYSGKRFGKKARELLLALIDAAEQRTA